MGPLFLIAILSVAVAKPAPGGIISPWGHSGYSSLDLVHQPAYSVAQPIVHASPVVHAAPVVQAVAQPVLHSAPVIAKPIAQATSYSSFQQIIHPVSVAHPIVHAAPVVHSAPLVQAVQPVVHSAPVFQTVAHSAPVYQTVAHSAPIQPVLQKYLSVGSYGHGW